MAIKAFDCLLLISMHCTKSTESFHFIPSLKFTVIVSENCGLLQLVHIHSDYVLSSGNPSLVPAAQLAGQPSLPTNLLQCDSITAGHLLHITLSVSCLLLC